MDPVKGQTLSRYLDAHGVPGSQGVEADVSIRILGQLMGALGYAHAQGSITEISIQIWSLSRKTARSVFSVWA